MSNCSEVSMIDDQLKEVFDKVGARSRRELALKCFVITNNVGHSLNSQGVRSTVEIDSEGRLSIAPTVI